VGGGEARGPSWRGRIIGVEGLKPKCEGDGRGGGGCVSLSARAISQGPTKLEISSANPPTTSPRKVSARIKNITHGAV
jgi:hypothetical protein